MRWDKFVQLEKYEFQFKLKWKEEQVKESSTLTLHQQIHNGLGYVAIVDQADILRGITRQGRRKLQPKVVRQKLNLQWKWKWKWNKAGQF